jgi:PAS domain S-box-containing protein
MSIEKDFSLITDLATCICSCQSSLICIFDSKLKIHTGISCPNQLTNLLSQQELLKGEVWTVPAGLLTGQLLGEETFSYLAAVPLITLTGELIGALCITDHKVISLDEQQKKALLLLAEQVSSKLINAKSSELLRDSPAKAEKIYNLFNQSSEIHCITDLEGKITYINESVYRVLGYAPKETIGKTIWDFCVSGERDRLRPEIYAALDKGVDRFHVVTRTLTKTGELRWFEWSDVVKEDHWLINGRDITARKQAELEARILTTAVERSSAAVFIRNIKMEITWANLAAEQLMGFSVEELIGKTFANLFTGPDTDTIVYGNAEDRVRENIPYEIEVHVYKKDKSPVWLYVSNSLVYDQAGQMERIVSVAFDITVRKQAELLLIKTRDEAIKLSRAKESFLSIMSHEMRTPLNAVIGMSRILLEEKHLTHQQEHLDILGFSAQNLLKLINDVLDFTKIETGNMVLEWRPVNLEQLLHNTIQSLKPKANEQGIRLFYEIAPNFPIQVYADQIRLYQIMMNLAGNAIKFTATGYVKVSLQVKEETDNTMMICFAVTDTGIGIARDKLETIFDAYTQAGSDITRKYGGTGLGLAITKKLIDLHDSEIVVQSELGHGTTFAFNITFKKASSVETEAANSEKEQALSGHVLVVDDSAVNRLVAGKILQKWGLTTDFAENGSEAVEKVKTNQFDLVLMDIHMPEMGGFEAAGLIRAEQEDYYQQLPILALTGSILDQEQQKIHSYGLNGYILKPFDTSELYRKVKQWLL